MRVATIIGSTRPARVGPTVGEWVHAIAEGRGDAEYVLVDLADMGLPLLDEPEPASSGRYTREHTRRWSRVVADLDAFVFVTPEYNHGLPASLKNALDSLYDEWNDKAAAIVCYGSTGGLRAAEHLRLVLAELQVAVVREQVSLSTYTDFEDFTRLTPADHQEPKAGAMLDQLLAWAGALRGLRAPGPAAQPGTTPNPAR